ncbi:MAG: sulfite exporter TauE/SafE family protein [Clostridium sp.]|nr:sulfite exporter TauE/SafE family protein [Clostridium sp.]
MMRVVLLCMIVYFLATFVQRVCGFGMGIVAIVILPYLIGSHTQTAAYTNMLSAVSSIWIAYKFRKLAKWRLIVPILIGSFCATFLTVRLSRGASFDLLEKILGVVLVVLSIYFLFFKGKFSIRPCFRNGVLSGACGGVLNGLFSTGGPPVVLYMLGTTENHAVYLATIQAYFAFNNVYATVIRLINGQITKSMMPGYAGGLVGMALGVYLGGKLEKHIPDEMFLKLIYILMAFSGVMMLV